MIQIYGRAANRFGRQQYHWVTLAVTLCLCGDEYVPNLAWDDGAVDIKSFQYIAVMNKTISGDGWCSADQIQFPEFVLDRPCSQAVVIENNAVVTARQPILHLGFPTVLPSTEPRRFSLLMGVNKPGWFRL